MRGCRTQVLDVDSTLVPQAGLVHAHVVHIVDSRPIAALGDPQAVDVKPRGFGNLLEDLCGRSIGADGDCFGQILDRAAWSMKSVLCN